MEPRVRPETNVYGISAEGCHEYRCPRTGTTHGFGDGERSAPAQQRDSERTLLRKSGICGRSRERIILHFSAGSDSAMTYSVSSCSAPQ